MLVIHKYAILHKELNLLWISISTRDPETSPLWIPWDDYINRNHMKLLLSV